MPKYKKNKSRTTTLSNNNQEENIQEPLSDGSNFDSQNQDEILEQIENVMEEKSYEKDEKVPQQTSESEEGIDAHVFVETKKEKRKKVKKPYEHTTFKHKMKVLGVLLVLGIFTGSGLGVWYFNFELRSKIDYGAFDPADYIQTVSETFANNSINAKESDGLNWVNVAKQKGLTPAQLTPADNFILAQHNVTLADSYIIDGIGYVDSTGVRQSIISRKKYNGSYYTFESISPSKISFIGDIILCDKYSKNAKIVSTYNSSNTNPSAEDWRFSKDIDTNTYVLESGGLPNTVQPYIISAKTVLEPTNDKSCVVLNEDGTYSFTMKLDTTTSVLNYARQVKRTGGLGSYPEFSNIEFTVVIDGDWNLRSFSIKENYSAVKGIKARCAGTLDYTVTLNGSVEMPV